MTSQGEVQISELITPVVSEAGLYLESVKTAPAGKRTRVVVVLDADSDEALDLDKVATVSRNISELLDEADVISGTYVLEVTSPGVERPLTLPRHWRRATGRLVAVQLIADGSFAASLGSNAVTGRVLASDDTTATIEVNTDKLEVPLSEIERASVEIEFNRK